MVGEWKMPLRAEHVNVKTLKYMYLTISSCWSQCNRKCRASKMLYNYQSWTVVNYDKQDTKVIIKTIGIVCTSM